MNNLVAVFTPERRQQIQLFFGSLAPLLILLGFANEEQTQQGLIIVGAILQFLAALLSLVNVRKGDYGAGWAIVRGAIYALAAVVSPALVFFGLYDESTNAALLTGLSLGLSSLSSLLSIFIGKSQQLEAVEKAAAVVVQENASTAPLVPVKGQLIVNNTDPEKDNFQLQLDQPWDELAKLGEFRIQTIDESAPAAPATDEHGDHSSGK